MFDPGSWPWGGRPSDPPEKVEEIVLVNCDVCNKEIEEYIHRWYDGRCGDCNNKHKWNTLKIGSRVKLKHANDSDVPKNISGLWVTIVDFNNRRNPIFECPRTNRNRTLKFSNMEQVEDKYIKR
jgi:hypothetical protein